ncbi:uncharacterized protein [Pseudorasbora parva]|uniref:uncharacterized protein n=1 Tax=Pseudorasbora parva TaxID=51549 RepID=UPI00351F09BE
MSKSDAGTKEADRQIDAHVETQSESARRSRRTHVPTEKMIAYQQEELQKKEKRLESLYNQWKLEARSAREHLKSDALQTQLAILVDTLEVAKNKVLNAYGDFREHVSPAIEMRRKLDACEAVTADIVKIVYERISGVDGDFDDVRERSRLRTLLDHQYAHSIFGSTVSKVSQKTSNYSGHPSVTSSLEVKRVDAAAEVAAKQAEYNVLLEETKQKEKINQLEEQHKRVLDGELKELEQIQARKDLKAAQAKLEIYSQEVEREKTNSPKDCSRMNGLESDLPQEGMAKQETSQRVCYEVGRATVQATATDTSLLVQAFHEGMAMSKLPVPEPPVFTGDPIHFIEFKQCFMALIDKNNISSADKMFYLKKYVSGFARKALEGTFFRTDDEAYQDAWCRLNNRYGQPFVIQKAFRERLASWPRIHPKDAIGLQAFSDFLNACQGAMPHVKGLQILNDYQENQKLVLKLPDWAISRWNRLVTQSLSENHEYPSFKKFAAFVSTEAEVACNPVTSFHTLRAAEPLIEKANLKEANRNRVRVFSTQMNTESQKVAKPVNKILCVLCQKGNHQLDNCFSFLSRPLEERRKCVQEKRLCYGCLKSGHSAKECRCRLTCSVCKRRHPTSLHDENFVKAIKTSLPAAQSHSNPNDVMNVVALSVNGEDQSLYTSMVVPVWVSTRQNPSCEKLVYALLDSQSDTTFIDKEVCDALQATAFPVQLKLTTMLGKDTVLQSDRVSGLRVRAYESGNYIDLPPTYTKDCIPVNRNHIPTCDVAKKWKHLTVIADKVPPLQDCDVALLIGYNCSRSMTPREVITGGDDDPYAIRTDLGWSIVGCSSPHSNLPGISRLCHRTTVKELPSITPGDVIRVLESEFKDTEEEGAKVSQDDILFLEKLKEGIRRNVHGHYQMPLPFKVRPNFPSNKQCAIIRLNHLKRKMLKDECYKERYSEFMNEIFQRGDAEEVHNSGKEGETWYLPHHGVFHPKKVDKLRVVFDCSARYEGFSLNDNLLQGPDLINNLNGILIRFRQHPIALMCDIEKMYHQFHVDESDRDFLRFLWWKDGNLNQPASEFRMKVHLFGATSSSGCANYGLKHLATENSNLYPFGSQFVIKNFYVDDGVISVENAEEAIKVADEARKLCAMGGLRLHKFVSNSKAVLDGIPTSERILNVGNFDLAFDELPLERTLGIQWERESDCFKFKVQLKNQPATRRGILSTVASVYDPLGLIVPVLLRGKRTLQEVCKRGSGWDDPLPDALNLRWERWRQDLNDLMS